MKTYKYNGKTEVSVPGVGIFKPGDEKESAIEINHPDFQQLPEMQAAQKKPQEQKKEDKK
jgi:hypothetical protein